MTFRLKRVPSTRPTPPTSPAEHLAVAPTTVRARRTRPVLRRLLAVALAGASLLGGWVASTDAAPKPGLVRDKRGNVYLGQVDEAAVPGKVVITSDRGGKTELFTQIVDSVKYFDTAQEEFDARLAALGKRDVPGRVALARWALTKKEPDLAARAAAEARAIDPASADVAAVEKQIAAVKPPPATAPATGPATAPAANRGPAKRMLTPDEVQIVRQREMNPADPTLRLQVPPELRKKAVDAGVVKATDLRGMSPRDLALKILTDGTPAMQREVKFQSDPAPLAEFKMKVNKALATGCASAACHGQAQAGKFALFPEQAREEAVLANLVILQKYTKTADGQERLMLNRTQPEASLLLGYMLPPELSKVPHPMLKEYKGAVRTAQDPTFVATQRWLGQTLKPFAPSYDDIDLTTDAPKPDPAKAADAGGAVRAAR